MWEGYILHTLYFYWRGHVLKRLALIGWHVLCVLQSWAGFLKELRGSKLRNK